MNFFKALLSLKKKKLLSILTQTRLSSICLRGCVCMMGRRAMCGEEVLEDGGGAQELLRELSFRNRKQSEACAPQHHSGACNVAFLSTWLAIFLFFYFFLKLPGSSGLINLAPDGKYGAVNPSPLMGTKGHTLIIHSGCQTKPAACYLGYGSPAE